jgi:hypothetical protein
MAFPLSLSCSKDALAPPTAYQAADTLSHESGRKKCRSVEIVMPADGTIAAHSIREDFGTSRFQGSYVKTSRFHAAQK